jgi:phosphoglycolate phosphatase
LQASVIFDLDGTLIDPVVGITNACAFMCERLNLPTASAADIRGLVGPSLQEGIREVFHLPPELSSDALTLFRQHYGSIGLGEFKVYPGISETLRSLRGLGVVLYVATSKPRVFATEIVDRAGWTELFNGIYGSELDGTRSDKASILKQALDNRIGDEPTVAVVGDRVEDVLAARLNSVPFVGVTWGYSEVGQLLDAGATDLANTAEELQSILESRLVDTDR